MTKIDFATTESEANDRAKEYLNKDPFPSCPRALLSSAEIHDYARVTAMLHPFYPDALKSASYQARIGGEFIRWDKEGKKETGIITPGDVFVLPENSISFVQTEPKFRLPHYIAVRFNLKITHVHRGLLLGTGPLVDPGFEGNLLIPLHNLTSTPYRFNTEEALIWVEFTKTSYGHKPKKTEDAESDRESIFVSFPERKKNKTPNYYLNEANRGEPIQSSIPHIIAESERNTTQSAQNAQLASDAAEKAKRTLERRSLIGVAGVAVTLVAVVIGLIALYVQTHSLIQDAIAFSHSLNGDVRSTDGKIIELQRRLATLEEDNGRKDRQVLKLQETIESLQIEANDGKTERTAAPPTVTNEPPKSMEEPKSGPQPEN